jgi:Pycsar effector protein
MKKEEKIRILENSLERNLSWISKANSIANFQFSIEAGMLGALVLNAHFDVSWPIFTIILTTITAILLIVCVFFGSMVYFPRTSGPKGSLIFFGGISNFEFNDYSENMKVLKMEGYLADLLNQVHQNAKIADTKYKWVKRGMVLLYVSLLPWLISLYCLSVINLPIE